MNEEFSKLALEAMDFHGAIDTDTDFKLTNDELQKFAELIVQKCIKISQVGSITENKLKEHFGVNNATN